MSNGLDPVIAQVLPKLPPFETETMTPASCRALLSAMAASRADVPVPGKVTVENRTIDGGIPVRIYRPEAGKVPTVVFFHGGGWVAGSLDTHDRAARMLAIEAGVLVVSVDYRQPPEAPFPAAFDDAFAALRWARANVATLGGDPARVAVAGDSAGGNLAAAVAIACRDAGVPLAAQWLIYPVTDVAGGFADDAINQRYPSRASNAQGYFLTLASMRWFAAHYLPDARQQSDPRVSPLRAASLAGLAPAVVCTAQFDPLCDEGIAYAKALRNAGVTVREHTGAGLIHGFFGMAGVIPAATEEVRRARADFRALLDAAG